MSQIAAALQVRGVSETASPWALDGAHSSAHFTVRHMMISNVRGEFSRVSGNVLLDPVDVTRSQIEVHIETASINTREEKRGTSTFAAPISSTSRSIRRLRFARSVSSPRVTPSIKSPEISAFAASRAM